MPQPISSKPEERIAVAGKAIFGAARRADLNEADGLRILVHLRRGGKEPLRAFSPQIIEHDVDAVCRNVSGKLHRARRRLAAAKLSHRRRAPQSDLSMPASRPVAMTFPAPRCFAICTASRPEMPVAPLTSTTWPGTILVRSCSAAHDDMAGIAIAAAAAASDIVRQRHKMRRPHHGPLGHAAERRARQNEIDPLATSAARRRRARRQKAGFPRNYNACPKPDTASHG